MEHKFGSLRSSMYLDHVRWHIKNIFVMADKRLAIPSRKELTPDVKHFLQELERQQLAA